MKQTAVEWLIEHIENENKNGYDFHPKYNEEIVEQAKEIEKQQQGYSEEDLREAFYYGYCCENKYGIEVTFNDWFIKFKNK